MSHNLRHRNPSGDGYSGAPLPAMIRRAEEISMADPKRRERGLAKMQEVYAGDVVVPPPGGSAFADLMLEQ
jgi:hypothetical protein